MLLLALLPLALAHTFSLRHVFHAGGQQNPGLLRRLDISDINHTHPEISILSQRFEVNVKSHTFSHYRSDISRDVEQRVDIAKSGSEFVLWGRPKNGRDRMRKQNDNPEVKVYQKQRISKNVFVPDETDPTTILSVGAMTYNTYYDPAKKSTHWLDMGGKWNDSVGFGWESDGIRGYVFADDLNEVMIITVKGTTVSFIGIGGDETSPRDKLNDNMMFSCCCAKQGWSWKPICECCTSNKQCDQNCLFNESSFDDSYYNLAQTIYIAVKSMFPQTTIWMAGHSLGGALASLVALTNGIPAIAYEAPGDLMYAYRIGLLPDFPDTDNRLYNAADYAEYLEQLPIYHIGNSQDPLFLGVCVGPGSPCWYGGYSMDSKCHVGKVCVYEPSNSKKSNGARVVDGPRKGLATDIRTHGIDYVIQNYLSKWDYVPDCKVELNCTECGDWEFYEG